jgi:hypothetical protein
MSRTMAKKNKRDDLTELAKRALKEAVDRVREEHRRSGEPMAIWRDGRVVFVHPDEDMASRFEARERPRTYKSKKRKETPR